ASRTPLSPSAFLEYENKPGRPSRPPSPKQNVRKNIDFEPLSTTTLILEDRPANLSAKPAEEAHVRGKVWSLAIGNELNITQELSDICLAQAKEQGWSFSMGGSEVENEDAGFSAADREASLEFIKLDISRTFPNLCIFQQGGPYHNMLHSILEAYTCYRPDVGNGLHSSRVDLELTVDAFIAFSNLLNKPCQMAFFQVDHGLMLTYSAAF
ncbi:hypothetical protein EI555_019836, partial [Monodon monoceros]